MKNTLLLIIFLVSIGTLSAQNKRRTTQEKVVPTASYPVKGQFEFGFGGGLNLSQVTDGNNNSSGSVFRFNVGISGEYYFSDSWSAKAKIIYDQKGWGDDYIVLPDGSKLDTDYHINYVTVPLLASWHFGKKKGWYMHFGPYVGFLQEGKTKTGGYDLTRALNKRDIGFTFGIGYKHSITKNMKLFIEADGQSGITNVVNSGSSNYTIRSSRSSYNVGLIFTP